VVSTNAPLDANGALLHPAISIAEEFSHAKAFEEDCGCQRATKARSESHDVGVL